MGEGGPGRFGLVGTGPTPIPLEGSSAASSLHLGPLGRARHRAFGAPTARGPSGPGDHPPPACGRPVSAVQAGATRAARSTARFPPARFRAGRDPGTSSWAPPRPRPPSRLPARGCRASGPRATLRRRCSLLDPRENERVRYRGGSQLLPYTASRQKPALQDCALPRTAPKASTQVPQRPGSQPQ